MIDRLPRWIWIGGFILSACAGLTNTIAVLGFSHRAISYVTGTISKTAIDLAHLNFHDALVSFSIVFFFFIGAIISGFIVKNESLCASRSYGIALILESIFLTLSFIGLSHNSFSGEWFAAIACGLQNALITTYSGSVIRTTHLTGITSDLGASLGSLLAGKPANKKKIAIQSILFFGFLMGSGMGVILFNSFNYSAILVPAGVVLLSGLTYTAFIKKERICPDTEIH